MGFMMKASRHPVFQLLAVIGIAFEEPLAALLLLNRSEAIDKFQRWLGTKEERELLKHLRRHWKTFGRFHDATPAFLGNLMRFELLKEYGQTALALGRLTEDAELEARGNAVLAEVECRTLNDPALREVRAADRAPEEK